MELKELYQEIILDHAKNPRNKGKCKDYNHDAKAHNPLCGDKVHIFLNLLDAFNSGKPIVDQAVKLPIHTGFVAVIADAKCTQSVDVLLQSVLIRRCLLFDT